MANRIIDTRNALKTELDDLGSSVNWQHITNQIGMFCFSGLSANQIDKLLDE